MSESYSEDEETTFEIHRKVVDVFNIHNRSSNRLWVTCSITSFLLYSAYFGESEYIDLLGSTIRRDLFFAFSSFVLSATVFAYTVRHSSAYRMSFVHHEIIESPEFGRKITRNYTYRDLCHLMIDSNLNRVYPLVLHINRSIAGTLYILMKVFIDVIFFIIPVSGLAVCLLSIGSAPKFLHIPATALIVISALIYTLFMIAPLKWNIEQVVKHIKEN